MKNAHTLSARTMEELIRVASGKSGADLVIVNALLLNVYTGEFLQNQSVSIKNGYIAFVGDHAEHTIASNTTVIDVQGKTLIPGLIDGHTHLASFFEISQFIPYAVKDGTTTLVTETMETYPIMGYEGVVEILASFKNQPIKIFGTAPAMVSISTAASGIAGDDLKKLLNRDDILGLGESYWQAVFQTPEKILPVFEDTLRAGKVLEGHSAGAGGKKLAAYLATGISSCHEPIDADQVLERLRLGLYVMIREGSIRRDLEAIARIRDAGVDTRRLILVTDGVGPEDLMENKGMAFVVQKAIDSGFSPVEAVQMATLNVAEHFSLDSLVGGIAPGRSADMVIVPDPGTITPEMVVSHGKIIFDQGQMQVSPRTHLFSNACRHSVHLPRPLTPDDFAVTAPPGKKTVQVRLMEMVTDLVTRETLVPLPVIHGRIQTDQDQDILKISAIDRAIAPGNMFTGFIKGFGLTHGAIASSQAWDTADIVVMGTHDADMADAVNHIHRLQGGVVIWGKGTCLAQIPLPVMGLMSDAPVPELARQIRALKTAAAKLGVVFPDPLLTLVTLTGAAIPYIRICEQGLVNLKDGKCRHAYVEPY
ncbi:MAG: amidohydrolase family protein [Desulfotignum sp.]|nr:amidohydrolase family protein [Desulfotignum sp.]MCF8137356.1 amidohydrolase family protein [Desulfotignum sp.]